MDARQSEIQSYMSTVATAFKKAELIKCCLPASIILSEILTANNIGCFVAIGYAVGREINSGFRHVWVVDEDGQDFDVGLKLTQMHDPSYPSWYVLRTDIPKDFQRLDMLVDADHVSSLLFENAVTSIKKFGTQVYWKSFATPALKRLRKVLFAELVSTKTTKQISKKGVIRLAAMDR